MDSKDKNQAETPSGGFGIKLDSIFEEVEKNLPTVDFDNSDVSFFLLNITNIKNTFFWYHLPVSHYKNGNVRII